MQIEINDTEGTSVELLLTKATTLGMYEAIALAEAIGKEVDKGKRVITINFEEIEDITSYGFGTISKIRNELQIIGGTIILKKIPRAMARKIDNFRITELFQIQEPREITLCP